VFAQRGRYCEGADTLRHETYAQLPSDACSKAQRQEKRQEPILHPLIFSQMIPNIRSNNEKDSIPITNGKVRSPFNPNSSKKKIGTKTAASRKNSPSISTTSLVLCGANQSSGLEVGELTRVVPHKLLRCKDISITLLIVRRVNGALVCDALTVLPFKQGPQFIRVSGSDSFWFRCPRR